MRLVRSSSKQQGQPWRSMAEGMLRCSHTEASKIRRTLVKAQTLQQASKRRDKELRPSREAQDP